MNEALHLADSAERRGRGGGRGGYTPLAVLMLVLGRLHLVDPLAFFALPDGVQELHVAHAVNEITQAYATRSRGPQSAAEANAVWADALARASARPAASPPWWTALAGGA